MAPHYRIQEITLHSADIGLEQVFAVATGAMARAQPVFVRLLLEGGSVGWGEMAPFPAITGETPRASLEAARSVQDWLCGQSLWEYRHLFASLEERLPSSPAARCGLETAMLDAFTRALGIPVWAHLGGAAIHSLHFTDITIPVTDAERTVALALSWHRLGFRRLKLKVGVDADLELEKIVLISRACEGVEFVLDANGGFQLPDARRFLSGLRRLSIAPVLVEQPLSPLDMEGATALRAEFGVRVVADEGARSVRDVLELARLGAAQVINLKIMKSGLREAIQMAVVARACGLELMIGGMLETRLAMGCSFALVLGLGGFDYLDLDTPLLLAQDPWVGGYQYHGARLLPWREPGLGIQPAPGLSFLPCDPRPTHPTC